MKRYYIEDENGSFWCENHQGYWSNEKHPEWSINNRFEGIYLWVLPMFLMMKLFARDLAPKIVKIPQNKKEGF